MTQVENAGLRRKSSGIAASLTLNCNLPTIPIINEPPATEAANTVSGDVKKKALRFDSLPPTEYENEEEKENKRRITDEIK